MVVLVFCCSLAMITLLRFYSNLFIRVSTHSISYNNMSSIQKNRPDKSHLLKASLCRFSLPFLVLPSFSWILMSATFHWSRINANQLKMGIKKCLSMFPFAVRCFFAALRYSFLFLNQFYLKKPRQTTAFGCSFWLFCLVWFFVGNKMNTNNKRQKSPTGNQPSFRGLC